MTDAQLFEETFNITAINSEKYDRVSRLTGISTDQTLNFTLDINSELFNVNVGDTLTMVLASTLNLDGTKDEKGWRDNNKEHTLADNYEYVCYGKNYRFEDGVDDKMKFFASFGGLLLFLEGPYKKMTSLKIEYVYMLLNKA
ncbi:DNA-directed RNA polymeras-like proteines i [Pleomassaria siparia CBS 279.74]|uniref:DNA-directed RNA polymerases I, II, and III subunit RPABC3 n=1 Tax=Pleomassaria siparia CBS 279.74 TaxID=1314801 RepID=A0A6G1JRN4_9PLEO|nr:DNA-directed RNA polymeras-like proteines i [Pleomassaria siparia CBS 279.74]